MPNGDHARSTAPRSPRPGSTPTTSTCWPGPRRNGWWRSV